MKHAFIFSFLLLTGIAVAQDKTNYVSFRKVTEIKGTEYVVTDVENMSKGFLTKSHALLFIHAKTGEKTQVDFPKDGYIEKVEQVKIDELGINKVLVAAQTVNLDQDKSIDWFDPTQLIIFSPDGKEKTQLTENNFFVRTWTVNHMTGTVVVTGHTDSNANGKYDKTDKHEILIYDLKTLKLLVRN